MFTFQAASGPIRIYLATLRDGAAAGPVLLMENDSAARYTPAAGGRLLFVRNDNLYAQALNRETRKLEGEPELVQSGVASAPGWHFAHFSVSRDGVLSWRPGRAAFSRVTTFDREGKELGVSGPPEFVIFLRLSPDESRLLVNGRWLLEPGQPGRQEIGAEQPAAWTPVLWKPDGASVLSARGSEITEHRVANPAEFRAAATAGGPELALRLEDLSPDGKHVLYQRGALSKAIYASRLDGAPADSRPVIQSPATVMNPRFSPDGRWIVYTERLRADDSIYVQPFPGPGLRRQVAASGNYPAWTRNGREIVFLAGDRVRAVAVEAAGAEMRAGPPRDLFTFRPPAGTVGDLNFLAVSREGSRFYLPQAVEQPDSGMIHVRLGWGNRPAR